MPNPKLPQFPAGTQLALVRKANVIDSEGNLRTTNIVEDIQIRVHRTIPKQIPDGVNLSDNPADLDPFEFKLSRPKLFAGEDGGLRAVPAGEEEFALFASHGIDFEQRETLRMCATCHFRPGVHSMLSRGGREVGRRDRVELRPSPTGMFEAESTKRWKESQTDWKLLRDIWRSRPAR